MCSSAKTMDKAQYKVLRYQKLMSDAIELLDYEFYYELWMIAKEQLRKMKAIG